MKRGAGSHRFHGLHKWKEAVGSTDFTDSADGKRGLGPQISRIPQMGFELEAENFELPFHCLVTSSATFDG